eukprot:ANDGO_02343.mRNA.1 Tubulin gamma-1 chain
MSIVTIQVGQCGNQVGFELFRTLANACEKAGPEFIASVRNTFFQSETASSKPGAKWTPRAVLIDMEPKVVVDVVGKSRTETLWSYEKCRAFTKQSGSANNWAFGFHVHGPSCAENIEKIISEEMDACDSLQAALILTSVAGGTGSGLGAFLAQMVRDLYPNLTIMNCVVWPYQTGEVIVQNFNALLTLSHLDSVSDAVWIFENDEVDLVCRHVLKEKRPSFDLLNEVIARSMAGVLLPMFHANVSRYEPKLREKVKSPDHVVQMYSVAPDATRPSRAILDAVSHLCSHPGYKLLTSKLLPQMPRNSIEFSTYTWHQLIKHSHQAVVCNARTENHIRWDVSFRDRLTSSDILPNRCVAVSVVLRGNALPSADPSPFHDKALFSDWRKDSGLQLRCSEDAFGGHEKMVSCFMNSQAIVDPLQRVIGKAHETFQANAYVHFYEKHGMERGDFDVAFVHCEQLLKDYCAL